jgi:exosortase E/protease (VPEID-CTERM system)
LAQSGLLRRLVLLGVVLAVEWIPLSAFAHTGLGAISIGRLLVACLSIFLFFGVARLRGSLERISSDLEGTPVAWLFFGGHICALLVFCGTSVLLMRSSQPHVWGYVLRVLWFAAAALAIALAGLTFVPLRTGFEFIRSTGNAWAYALVGGFVAWGLISPSGSLWNASFGNPIIDLTFAFVKVLLNLFVSDVVADRPSLTIGTHAFPVTIAAACSGIEGLGLMLAFSIAWLWFFRRECRFPQAFLLIPAGLFSMWILNAVRITALILIGNAGAASIALGGFHSQAGWIAFCGVALAFSAAARRLPWFTAGEPKDRLQEDAGLNPSIAYLMPFLVILAASLVSRAASGGFEWLYPLRFFAAAVALRWLWSRYQGLDWRFGWFAPAAGALVFVLWIALDRFVNSNSGSAIPSALARASLAGRNTWIAVRVLASVVTVPIAEELAFRGFLMRRVISSDFESVSLQGFSWLALLSSSAAFGVLHGSHWFAGAIAGILYGLALARKGRIGDAVVAHATTNALLAVYVLAFHQWQLW